MNAFNICYFVHIARLTAEKDANATGTNTLPHGVRNDAFLSGFRLHLLACAFSWVNGDWCTLTFTIDLDSICSVIL